MVGHDTPCEPLKALQDDVKAMKSNVNKIQGDVSCFRGKFDVMFHYMVPKSVREDPNNYSENPGVDKARIEQVKIYRQLLKTMGYVVVGLVAIIVGFKAVGL